jgi:ribonuclease HI
VNAPAATLKATLYSDGGARGNPGPAGAGAILTAEDGRPLAQISQYLGTATNNVAEYRALILGLEAACAQRVGDLTVCLDSELVVRQLNGAYRVKDPKMLPLHAQVRRLFARFERVSVAHIPRERNKDADKLVNAAIDGYLAAQPQTG